MASDPAGLLPPKTNKQKSPSKQTNRNPLLSLDSSPDAPQSVLLLQLQVRPTVFYLTSHMEYFSLEQIYLLSPTLSPT